LKSFLARTGILVIASHSMTILRQWCNKGMLLEQGKLVALGPLEDVVSIYASKLLPKEDVAAALTAPAPPPAP
jgi:ABC-2 type transport system ATP-binding protein/lipopolysaccharide transport system ATP-binding protein